MRKSETMDMVHGPLLKNLFLFSLPLIASYTLQIAFNAADTIVVGKFSGADGLAAVGATTPLVNLLISLFNGIAVGANIVIANMIGRQDQNNIPRAVHTSYWLALAGGILLTALGFFLSGPMLAAISTPADIIDQSVLYMRIYFAGSLPLLIYDF
ncbi:MATE family efflux transporter, partial [Galactobacillus timonensis]|uniref:MATE family efflux transporter n=1 Tax=Galactobacillus timonensis TaxID=2041840 RepID=UPI00240A659E